MSRLLGGGKIAQKKKKVSLASATPPLLPRFSLASERSAGSRRSACNASRPKKQGERNVLDLSEGDRSGVKARWPLHKLVERALGHVSADLRPRGPKSKLPLTSSLHHSVRLRTLRNGRGGSHLCVAGVWDRGEKRGQSAEVRESGGTGFG